MSFHEHPPELEDAVRDTQRWLERAVIGLNLCPFAKAVHVKELVHYAVSDASDRRGVMDDLIREFDELVSLGECVRETTLLVVTRCLSDFLDYNDFMAGAERMLRRRGLVGVIQLASFHPQYQFAGTEPGDITNCTNRSPWPTIHLLRESSVSRAVAAMPAPEAIYDANMETLRRVGAKGWSALGVGPST